MNEEPLDLSPLDPELDGSLDEMVRAINRRAAPELARREGARGPFTVIAGWTRPALALAAALAAVSLLGIGWDASRSAVTPLRAMPEELGLTGPVAEWVMEGRTPTQDDLLLAMEDDL